MKKTYILAFLMVFASAAFTSAQDATPTAAAPVLTDTPTPVTTDTPTATDTESATPLPPFPSFFGGTEDALVRVNEGGLLAWTTPVAGGVYSVEPELDGSLLVAGGDGGVFLLARRDGDLKTIWNWKSLGFKAGDITCATAADQDPGGRVSLVLAAEPGMNRIFLAEARSSQVKVRWEFKTLLPPRQVGLCPDTKHFWVLCSDGLEGGAWSVQEIDYKKEKADWTFETYLSAQAPSGFIRTYAGWNLLAVPSDSAVAAFLKDTSRVWQSPPLGTSEAKYLSMALRNDPLGDGFLTSFTPLEIGSSTRMAYLSATDGEEITHLDQWSNKGAMEALPAFRCLAPGPVTKKKSHPPVKKKSAPQPSSAGKNPPKNGAK